MILTANALMVGTGCTASVAAVWLPHVQKAIEKWAISTPNMCAAFLANAGVETGSLTKLIESTNYNAQGLADTWKSRYAVDPKAKVKVPNALALRIARNPQVIANLTYADRMGNGGPETGDGYRYRGRGLFQITGKDMYRQVGNALGIDLVSNPDQLLEPEYAAQSAAWYFVFKGCADPAESGNFSKVVLIINGDVPNDANHGPLRTSRFIACRKLLVA